MKTNFLRKKIKKFYVHVINYVYRKKHIKFNDVFLSLKKGQHIPGIRCINCCHAVVLGKYQIGVRIGIGIGIHDVLEVTESLRESMEIVWLVVRLPLHLKLALGLVLLVETLMNWCRL